MSGKLFEALQKFFNTADHSLPVECDFMGCKVNEILPSVTNVPSIRTPPPSLKPYDPNNMMLDLPDGKYIHLSRNPITNRWSGTISTPDKADPGHITFKRANHDDIGFAFLVLKNRRVVRSSVTKN